jgi:uncharacterized membrane protein YgcG
VRSALATLALLMGAGISAHAQVPLPALDARVTDLTGTLTAGQQASLEEKLAALETRKGAQVAVLILPTTQPEDIAQFGIRLAEAWKIGRGASDDGAILIVAKDDRALRIEVGHGLEGALTDVTSSRIINETIVPLFKQGDFYGGVNAGLDQMIRVIEGESLPPPDQTWRREAERGKSLPGVSSGGSRPRCWPAAWSVFSAGGSPRHGWSRSSGASSSSCSRWPASRPEGSVAARAAGGCSAAGAASAAASVAGADSAAAAAASAEAAPPDAGS